MTTPDEDIINAARRCYDALGRGSTADIDRIARFGQSIRDAANKEAAEVIGPILPGWREAVHFVRNNAMNMERDYPEIVTADEAISAARRWMQKNGGGDDAG